MKPKRLIVDTYQPESFVRQMEHVFGEIKVAPLGEFSGDVLVQLEHKTVLFETKESDDFLASIVDNRLFKQAEGMTKITPWSFLVYKEFHYDRLGHVMAIRDGKYGATKWTQEHVDGVLMSVTARGLIPRVVRHTFADTIRRILDWCDTADQGSVTREKIRLSPFDEYSQDAVNLLSWFDGIGVLQAKRFLDWAGKRPLYEYWQLATTPFDGDNRPEGWNNNTIARHRKQLGYQDVKRGEWLEQMDVE